MVNTKLSEASVSTICSNTSLTAGSHWVYWSPEVGLGDQSPLSLKGPPQSSHMIMAECSHTMLLPPPKRPAWRTQFSKYISVSPNRRKILTLSSARDKVNLDSSKKTTANNITVLPRHGSYRASLGRTWAARRRWTSSADSGYCEVDPSTRVDSDPPGLLQDSSELDENLLSDLYCCK